MSNFMSMEAFSVTEWKEFHWAESGMQGAAGLLDICSCPDLSEPVVKGPDSDMTIGDHNM